VARTAEILQRRHLARVRLPYDEETLRIVSDQLAEVQDGLGRAFRLESPSNSRRWSPVGGPPHRAPRRRDASV